MPAQPATASVRARELQRRLGPLDSAAIVVSNVIGGGIFITPVFIASTAPDPLAMLGAWLVGGLLAFAGAMAYAELAAARPRAGGEYVYLSGAFGPLPAFLTGWTSFVAGFSGAIAVSALGLATYLGRFVPIAADTTPLLTIPLPFIALTVTPRSLTALAVIALLSVIHIRGLGPGRLVQNSLAVIKTSALVVFILLGFALGTGSTANFTGGETVTPAGWLLALVPVMFSYSGWNAAAYVAEEIRDPGRNLPLALAIGTGTVVAIYLSLNLLYLYAMPVSEIAALDRGIVDETAERLFGFVAADALAAFTVISIAASISAMVLAGPRVYFAMARDGIFIPAAAEVHHRYRTPATSIVCQSLWSGILVLSGTLAQLVNYTGFAVVLFAGVAVLSLFVFRLRDKSPRPFKTWGYPVVPALFVAACAIMVVNEIWRSPGTAGAGLLVIAAGIPVYFLFKRRMPKAA
jgi:APA family basic amino acid/polyamine antiporter